MKNVSGRILLDYGGEIKWMAKAKIDDTISFFISRWYNLFFYIHIIFKILISYKWRLLIPTRKLVKDQDAKRTKYIIW
jgi:hypothetical protein